MAPESFEGNLLLVFNEKLIYLSLISTDYGNTIINTEYLWSCWQVSKEKMVGHNLQIGTKRNRNKNAPASVLSVHPKSCWHKLDCTLNIVTHASYCLVSHLYQRICFYQISLFKAAVCLNRHEIGTIIEQASIWTGHSCDASKRCLWSLGLRYGRPHL